MEGLSWGFCGVPSPKKHKADFEFFKTKISIINEGKLDGFFFLHGFLVLTLVFLEFMASRADIPLVFCGKIRAFLVHSK